jgi:two-component system chemotaxis sensor kinase CheA
MSSTAEDDIRADFLVEAGELVQRLSEQLMELEARPADKELLNAVFRAFHTVKGGAGFLALQPLVDLCHAAEDVFNALRAGKIQVDAALLDATLQSVDQVNAMMKCVAADAEPSAAPPQLIASLRSIAAGKAVVADPNTISEDEFEALLDELQGKKSAPAAAPAASAPSAPVPAPPVSTADAAPVPAARADEKKAETSVRVDTARLDKMMNMVGELVLVRNRLKALAGNTRSDLMGRAVAELDHITRGLQNAVMQVRMQPIRKVFSRFPRLARDVARGLDKQVEVTLEGEDTDLDKNLVEALADPLVHLVRNSVDHGIEMPAERLKRGKPAAGQLLLSAQQAGDHILIIVRDDGAGMDAERLRTKAVEKGLLDAPAAAKLSADECFQLIFLPGFSTKEQVSDLSGRGVGMDVVQSRIRELNGSVHIDSRLGQGTTIRIQVPLTLAILPALMVVAEGRSFALPLAAVHDVFVLDPSRVRALDRWQVVLTKNDMLRLVHLDPWLAPVADDRLRHVVVATVGDERFGFVVSEVRGRDEVVIKPLGATLRGLAGVAGATVMADGRVALILDLPGLVQACRRGPGAVHG